jgi:hypothetical protein
LAPASDPMVRRPGQLLVLSVVVAHASRCGVFGSWLSLSTDLALRHRRWQCRRRHRWRGLWRCRRRCIVVVVVVVVVVSSSPSSSSSSLTSLSSSNCCCCFDGWLTSDMLRCGGARPRRGTCSFASRRTTTASCLTIRHHPRHRCVVALLCVSLVVLGRVVCWCCGVSAGALELELELGCCYCCFLARLTASGFQAKQATQTPISNVVEVALFSGARFALLRLVFLPCVCTGRCTSRVEPGRYVQDVVRSARLGHSRAQNEIVR